MGRGLKSPGGPETPRLERPPQGDETYGVAAEGNRVLGGDGPGRGGDKDYPATQAASGAGSEHGAIYDYSRPGLEVQPGNHTDRAAADIRYG